jgi:hypothetical protein
MHRSQAAHPSAHAGDYAPPLKTTHHSIQKPKRSQPNTALDNSVLLITESDEDEIKALRIMLNDTELQRYRAERNVEKMKAEIAS